MMCYSFFQIRVDTFDSCVLSITNLIALEGVQLFRPGHHFISSTFENEHFLSPFQLWDTAGGDGVCFSGDAIENSPEAVRQYEAFRIALLESVSDVEYKVLKAGKNHLF